MQLYAKYIGLVYFKFFAIIFIALELFYIGIDALTKLNSLPSSANLVLIYLGLTAIVAIKYILPLSLMLALIAAVLSLVRSNELVSLYALGVSKNRVIIVPFCIALVLTIFSILLNSTKLAYAYDYQNAIRNSQTLNSYSFGIFLKYNEDFVYISTLLPNANEAIDVRVFHTENGELKSQLNAARAKFKDGSWQLYDVKTTTLPQNIELGKEGLFEAQESELVVKSDLPAQLIDNIFNSGLYSLTDAIATLKALKDQQLDLTSVKSALYTIVFFPFFAPFMVAIMFYYMPSTGRFAGLALTGFAFIGASVGLWGILFVLGRFAQGGVVPPELAIIAPIVVLGAFLVVKFIKNR